MQIAFQRLFYGVAARTYRARLYRDGKEWCVLQGANSMSGVCGFGRTPQEAWSDFTYNRLGTRGSL